MPAGVRSLVVCTDPPSLTAPEADQSFQPSSSQVME